MPDTVLSAWDIMVNPMKQTSPAVSSGDNQATKIQMRGKGKNEVVEQKWGKKSKEQYSKATT